MSSTIYCPYSNADISYENSSVEHIIPLSLGGVDEFTIRVDRATNSKLGAMVDGLIANDPIIAMIRAKVGASGQSGIPSKAIWKKTRAVDGRPLQAVFCKDDFLLYDPVGKKILEEQDTRGLEFSAELKLDPHVRIPFAAKVALGTGYFLFGNTFRQHAQHHHLRVLLSPFRSLDPKMLRNNKTKYLDRCYGRDEDRKRRTHQVVERLMSFIGASAVVVGFGDNFITFFLGLFGDWQATITVPAKVNNFPSDGQFDLGHVIVLREGGMRRMSFREATYELGRNLFGDKLPPYQEVQKNVETGEIDQELARILNDDTLQI